MANIVKVKTVKLIARFIRPLCEEGLLSVPEMNEILGNLKNLAAKGEMLPAVQPKLIDQAEDRGDAGHQPRQLQENGA